MAPETREYLGFEDANKILWKIKKQLDGKRNWEEWWGKGQWMKEYKYACMRQNE